MLNSYKSITDLTNHKPKALTELFACWVILHFYSLSADFSHYFLSKNTIRVSSSLDKEQDGCPCSGSNLFAKVISRRQKFPLAGKE